MCIHYLWYLVLLMSLIHLPYKRVFICLPICRLRPTVNTKLTKAFSCKTKSFCVVWPVEKIVCFSFFTEFWVNEDIISYTSGYLVWKVVYSLWTKCKDSSIFEKYIMYMNYLCINYKWYNHHGKRVIATYYTYSHLDERNIVIFRIPYRKVSNFIPCN